MSVSKKILLSYGGALTLLAASVLITIFWIARVERTHGKALDLRIRTVAAGMNLLRGIHHSHAALHAYVTLKDERLKEERDIAWTEEIDPALGKLEQLSKHWNEPTVIDSVNTLIPLLEDLRSVQAQVEAVSTAEDTPPPLYPTTNEARRMASMMEEEIRNMLHLEDQLDPASERKGLLETMKELRDNLDLGLVNLEFYLLSGEEDFRQESQKHWNRTLKHLEDLETTTSRLSNQQARSLEKLGEARKAFLEIQKKLFALPRNDQRNKATFLLVTQSTPRTETLSKFVSEVINAQKHQIVNETSAAGKQLHDLKTAEWAILVTGVCLSLLCCTFMMRSTTKKLSRKRRELQLNTLDLQRVSAEQRNGSKEYSKATGEVFATVDELYSAASQIAARCRKITDQTSEAVNRCKLGSEAVHRAQDVAIGIKKEIDTIIRHMLDLGDKSRHIELAAELITELSDRTTILSHNAAIEAGAAGEAGRPFAALADQLAQISDRARTAVGDVRKIIEEIQDSTNTTIMATEEGLKTADLGLKVQNEVVERVQSLAEGIQAAQTAACEIETTASQQSKATQRVKKEVENILISSRRLENASEKMLAIAGELSESSGTLKNL